jgi:hypothetical protein
VRIEIEVPDPPEGWAVGGFREAHVHELMWSGDGWIACRINTLGKYLVCVKAKPLWEPSPELVAVLRPGWLTQDENARLTLHSKRPRQALHSWVSDGSQLVLWCVRGELLPPTKLPWYQCCFKIGEPE